MRPSPWWALPPLMFAQRYAQAAVPPAVMDAIHAACPRWLRHTASHSSLYEVSWSNLSIAAFPGISWSRSLGEALRFARTRVMPLRGARADLAVATKHAPQLRSLPWYGLKHRSRIVRWVFGRAARVQTVDSVALAMMAPGDDAECGSR